jgi:hypothetical protein
MLTNKRYGIVKPPELGIKVLHTVSDTFGQVSEYVDHNKFINHINMDRFGKLK